MKQEFYIKDNKLISKEEWQQIVLGIKNSITKDLNDKAKAKELLTKEIIKAIEQRIPDEKFGILFSGGVDSSLIALISKKIGKDFVCYTIGFKDENTKEPEDIIYSILVANKLGLKIKTKILDLNEAEDLIKRTVKILGPELNNVVNVGVGGVVLGCIEMAKKYNIKHLFSGLGSEEIFAGYQRHKLAKDKQAECWKGLINMYERDILRDFTIANSEKITFSTPFLDKELIGVAMKIPDKFKINNETSKSKILSAKDKSLSNAKVILRETAEELGLPKKIAWRGKKAAQYGSRLDKAISKLARKKGFRLKKDYLKSLE